MEIKIWYKACKYKAGYFPFYTRKDSNSCCYQQGGQYDRKVKIATNKCISQIEEYIIRNQ